MFIPTPPPPRPQLPRHAILRRDAEGNTDQELLEDGDYVEIKTDTHKHSP